MTGDEPGELSVGREAIERLLLRGSDGLDGAAEHELALIEEWERQDLDTASEQERMSDALLRDSRRLGQAGRHEGSNMVRKRLSLIPDGAFDRWFTKPKVEASLEEQRAFLDQQMDRLPTDSVLQQKHIAWCRRECRRLNVPIPRWFIEMYGNAGMDEMIIGDYHPSAISATPASVDIEEDEGHDLDVENGFLNDYEKDEHEESEEYELGDGEEDDAHARGAGFVAQADRWVTITRSVSADGSGVLRQTQEPAASSSSMHQPAFTLDAAIADGRALYQKALEAHARADTENDPALALAAIREARACLELTARLARLLPAEPDRSASAAGKPHSA
jgi:hypothetical protein